MPTGKNKSTFLIKLRAICILSRVVENVSSATTWFSNFLTTLQDYNQAALNCLYQLSPPKRVKRKIGYEEDIDDSSPISSPERALKRLNLAREDTDMSGLD